MPEHIRCEMRSNREGISREAQVESTNSHKLILLHIHGLYRRGYLFVSNIFSITQLLFEIVHHIRDKNNKVSNQENTA